MPADSAVLGEVVEEVWVRGEVVGLGVGWETEEGTEVGSGRVSGEQGVR